jgi:hypothetical protein
VYPLGPEGFLGTAAFAAFCALGAFGYFIAGVFPGFVAGFALLRADDLIGADAALLCFTTLAGLVGFTIFFPLPLTYFFGTAFTDLLLADVLTAESFPIKR